MTSFGIYTDATHRNRHTNGAIEEPALLAYCESLICIANNHSIQVCITVEEYSYGVLTAYLYLATWDFLAEYTLTHTTAANRPEHHIIWCRKKTYRKMSAYVWCVYIRYIEKQNSNTCAHIHKNKCPATLARSSFELLYTTINGLCVYVSHAYIHEKLLMLYISVKLFYYTTISVVCLCICMYVGVCVCAESV